MSFCFGRERGIHPIPSAFVSPCFTRQALFALLATRDIASPKRIPDPFCLALPVITLLFKISSLITLRKLYRLFLLHPFRVLLSFERIGASLRANSSQASYAGSLPSAFVSHIIGSVHLLYCLHTSSSRRAIFRIRGMHPNAS